MTLDLALFVSGVRAGWVRSRRPREAEPPPRQWFTTFPGAAALEEHMVRSPLSVEPLAAPPPGSGLKPVFGTRGMPLLGDTFIFLRAPLRWGRKRDAELGSVSWTTFLGTKMVLVTGGEATEIVMQNKERAFSQSGWEYFIGPFFRRGLMLLDFDEHLSHRRIMQAAFTRPRIAGYMDHVHQISDAAMRAWGYGLRLLYPALKEVSLDIATRVFMAAELGPQARVLNEAFVDTTHAGFAIVRRPFPGGLWSAGLRGRKILEDFFRAELPKKRARGGDDLFSALCQATSEEGERFSDDDIVSHMIFLMMAAHDTSTITTTVVSYHLARYPAWQERVRREILAAGDGPLDLDVLEGLVDLDMVIKESLRVVAPVHSLARLAVKDTEILGHYIPKGTQVALSPWGNHFKEEYWPDADRFDPERFSEARREDKAHRYAWMPFGGGAHKCIGLSFGMNEVKTLLVNLLRRYRLELPAGFELRWEMMSLPVPANGLPVLLRPLGSTMGHV